jgi:hypothetical protein
MPEISEEEYREYIDLKRKEAERQKRIEEMLGKGTTPMSVFRKDLNTVRGYASVFANVLQKEYERRGKPKEFVLDTWRRVQNYLPARLFGIVNGKVNIKHTFRKHLRDFGWSFTINYKNGTFIVKKRS